MSPPAGQQLLNRKFLKIASPMRVIMPKSIINLTFLDFKAFNKNIEALFVFMQVVSDMFVSRPKTGFTK